MNINTTEVENFIDTPSDAIITIGTRIIADSTKFESFIDQIMEKKSCEFIYMHPIDDVFLQDKYTQYIKYEAGSEEGVFALLAFFLIKQAPVACQKYLEDLDIGCLSGESSVGEEEFELLAKTLHGKKNITLLVGDDIIHHAQFENISNLLRLIYQHTNISVRFLNSDIEIDFTQKNIPDMVADIETYNGTIIYTAHHEDDILRGSRSFATAAKIKDNDMVSIGYKDFSTQKKFIIDSDIRGTVALYPLKVSHEINPIVSGYRFKQVKIQRVGI